MSDPTLPSTTPAAGVTDVLFGECLYVLTQRAGADTRAADHLRSTVRMIRELWETEPDGPCQRRALRLLLETFIIETVER